MPTKKKEIDVIFCDVTNRAFGSITKQKLDREDYHAILDMLDVRIFDIARRKVGEKYFTFICDDEGLLVETPIVSAIESNGKAHLVGNLIICKERGSNLASLSEDDMNYIFEHIGYTHQNGCIIPVITDISY